MRTFTFRLAPHHRRFLRFAFEGTAYQYSALPFWLALVNRTFSKCKNAVLIPPQSEWDARSQLSGRLADFSSVPGPTHQPCRHVASSLGVSKAICQHTEAHSCPESVYNCQGLREWMRRRPNRWRKKAFINKTNEQTKTTP